MSTRDITLYKIFLVIVSAFSFIFILNINSKQADAFSLIPNQSGSVPDHFIEYLEKCGSYGPSPAYIQFASSTPSNTVDTVVVDYGTQVIDFYWNVVGTVCKSNSAVTNARYEVLNGSIGMWGSLGKNTTLSFGPNYQTVGYTIKNSIKISYDNGSPFTTTTAIGVQVNTAGINQFTNGEFGCIAGPGGDRGSLTNVSNCTQTDPTFYLNIVVLPKPIPGCIDKNAINYEPKATEDDGSCYYDVCSNIDGNQTIIPTGYSQASGTTTCLFPKPSCSVTNVSIGIGKLFTMKSKFTNNADITLDTKSVSYGSVISGTPGSGSDNITKGSSKEFTSSSHSFNTTGDKTITWTITYGTQYGDQTVSCDGTVSITVATPTCSVVNFDVTVGDLFNPKVTVNNTNAVQAQIISATYNINPGGKNGSVPSPISNTTANGSTTYDGSATSIDTAGLYTLDYTVVWKISGAGGTLNCDKTASGSIVSNTPYTRFYGNDIIACGGDVLASAGYSGANAPGTYRGSASQLAIFAAGQISGVMPGSQYTGRVNPWDLAFANSGGSATSYPYSFGGGIAACPLGIDYAVTTNGTLSNITGGGSLASGVYEWSGSEIKGTIDDGKRIVIYVGNPNNPDGTPGAPKDIVISKNGGGPLGPGITYANTSWASVGQIPSFTLIATGNIYIQDDVVQLDGHYVAGGDIYTCSPRPAALGNSLIGAETETGASRPLSDYIINSCNNQLVINGSFKANKIHFLRSNGTVRNGANYEPFNSANIAEVFRFSPEIYLTNGGGINQNTTNTTKFDSIVARPPAY